MDLKHYVATTRQVDTVITPGLPDQYWYRYDGNDSADIATPYFRCGQYIDNNGTVESPTFFNPQNEDNDYQIGAAISPNQLQSRGSSETMFSLLFSELEQSKEDLLLFMFGYHNPMVKEFDHVQRIHENFIQSANTNIGRILMITWPSQGFGEYNQELGGHHGEPAKDSQGINSDVAVTGNALAIFLLKLRNYINSRNASAPPNTYRPKLHFIVQSMANQVWNASLLFLINHNLKMPLNNTFKRLMLTSPDIRDDIFQQSQGYYQSTDLADQAYVIHSLQDTILQAANVFHRISGHSRLGLSGPSAPALIPLNTYLLDVVQGHRSFHPVDYNHRYFEYHPAIINFYASVFNETVLPRINSIFAR